MYIAIQYLWQPTIIAVEVPLNYRIISLPQTMNGWLILWTLYLYSSDITINFILSLTLDNWDKICPIEKSHDFSWNSLKSWWLSDWQYENWEHFAHPCRFYCIIFNILYFIGLYVWSIPVKPFVLRQWSQFQTVHEKVKQNCMCYVKTGHE